MDNLFWIGFVGAALALIFAYLQKCKVMKCSEGDEKMVKIASSIRAGANAYLKQQYSTVAKVFAVVFVILLIIAFASKGQMLSRVTPFAFLTGGIWSMLAGLIGMKIATAANARTANAAHESLNHGLNVAFSSGTVMGFTVVGLGILDITLWFIGLRYIGKITAQRAHALGMTVLAYDPFVTDEAAREFGAEKVDLDEGLARADFVSVHVRLMPETTGLVDLDLMRKMKPSAVLVNTARGNLVDEDALYEALRGKVISGAIIDAYSQEPLTASPLFSLDNVILSPHAGAFTTDALNAMSRMSVDQLFQYVDGATPDNLVTAE